MQYVCLLDGTQQASPLHGDVRAGSGEEMKNSGSGRDAIRGGSSGVPGILTPTLHGIILKIPGEGAHSDG